MRAGRAVPLHSGLTLSEKIVKILPKSIHSYGSLLMVLVHDPQGRPKSGKKMRVVIPPVHIADPLDQVATQLPAATLRGNHSCQARKGLFLLTF